MSNRGFTLIELTVIVFLVSIMLFLAVPAVRDTMLNDEIESTVNHLVTTSKELRNDAVRNQVDYILNLDLSKNLVWSYSADMTPEARDEMKKHAFQFTADVRIEDICCYGKGKISDGEALIKFLKEGYIQPTIVHLASGGKHFTLAFHPFLSTVKTYDDYIDCTFFTQ